MSASIITGADARRPHYLWELRPYFRQVAGQLVIGSMAGIIMNTAVVLPAILLGRAIDAIHAFSLGEADAAAVTGAALLYVLGTLATEGPRTGKRWWLMTANARIRASLRADCLRGVLGWPMERLHRTPVGDLMSRIVGDVEVLGVGVREFTIETWDTVLFSISLVVAMLLFDAGLTALALFPVPVALFLSHASGRWVQRRTAASREANAALTGALQEQLAGVRVLRLFGRTATAVERVAALSDRYAGANLAAVRLKGGLQPVYTALVTGGVVFVVWVGGSRVVDGALSLGAFVAFLELYLRFVNRGFRIPQLVNSIQTGGAAYERLRPLLAPPLGVTGEPPFASFQPGRVMGLDRRDTSTAGVGDPSNGSDSGDLQLPLAQQPPSGPVAVRFESVRFRYPGATGMALDGITLNVPPGALIGVTGPVGAGKSALARATLALYPLEDGRVLLDGEDAASVSRAWLAARAGYLPQDGYLFSGSVRENVLLRPRWDEGGRGSSDPAPHAAPDSDSALDDALARAIAVAALEEDLRAFPQGVETEIGELGVRVSGGQRQRISLARAVTGPDAGTLQEGRFRAGAPGSPGLLVLDDPFSAVDVDTEVRIIRALREAFGPTAPPERCATILLFSHRLASFPLADRVVVLDGGRVVEAGTHKELMHAGGLYARIYSAQRRAEGDIREEMPVTSGAPMVPVEPAMREAEPGSGALAHRTKEAP
jgi:ATP-binding cassette, subfamily B, multidrug efflux pump